MSSLYIGIGSASGALVMIGIVLKVMNGNIGKKQDTTTCDAISDTLKEQLSKDDEKFTKILDEQVIQGRAIAVQTALLEVMSKSVEKIANGK